MSTTNKKLKKFSIGLVASGALLVGVTQAADNTPVKSENTSSSITQIAASIVNFLTDAMYPNTTELAQTETTILNKQATAPEEKNPIKLGAQKSNSNLLVSSLSSLPSAIRNTPVITKNGLIPGGSGLNSAAYFSKNKMKSFLCGNGVPAKACLYDPSIRHPLIKTLIGDPNASPNGGLTTSDTVLSNKKIAPATDFNLNPGMKKKNNSNEATAFLNYNSVLNSEQPSNLLAAKYYGLYLTGAYDINLANANHSNRKFLNETTGKGLGTLRNNRAFQKYVLAVRKLAATNSTLMSNILYLASQEAVNKAPNAEADLTSESMSQAQLDHMIGNRRLNDGGAWVKKVNTESPTELLREQTLMMAEALHQREENHVLLKRLLATLTIVASEGKAAYTPDLTLVKKKQKS